MSDNSESEQARRLLQGFQQVLLNPLFHSCRNVMIEWQPVINSNLIDSYQFIEFWWPTQTSTNKAIPTSQHLVSTPKPPHSRTMMMSSTGVEQMSRNELWCQQLETCLKQMIVIVI